MLITELWNRLAENKAYKKAHPNLVKELMGLEEKHKKEAIDQLL